VKQNINTQVGKRIQVLRKGQGLNQEELADICGLHRSHLGAVERGEVNVTLVTLERIAASLRVPLKQFLESDKEKAS